MFDVFDTFTQRHPVAARRIVAAANVAVMVLPGGILLAIATGQLVAARVGVFLGIVAYAAGYAAAVLWYGRRLRAAVAQARRDPLTGLPTRAVADEILDAATRDGTAMTVALADIDGLHAINTLGLAAGDRYISIVAERLARAIPPGGRLVRQGGDEFTLLAPGTDPHELAAAIGAAMAGPAVIAGYRIQPRVSVGIAASGGGGANYARACADAAMFTAKAAGGNHIRVYQPDRDGRPRTDGTRPLTRRRDINPLAHDQVAWQPTPGDELLPLLVSAEEARILGEAVSAARQRWAHATAEARAAAQRPAAASSTAPDRITVEPTPAGYRRIAGTAADQQARYTRLADRLAAVIDTQEHGDAYHKQPAAIHGRGRCRAGRDQRRVHPCRDRGLGDHCCRGAVRKPGRVERGAAGPRRARPRPVARGDARVIGVPGTGSGVHHAPTTADREDAMPTYRVTFSVIEKSTYEAYVKADDVTTPADAIAWVDAETDELGYSQVAKSIDVDTLDVTGWFAEEV